MFYFRARYFRASYFASQALSGGGSAPASTFVEWIIRARRRGKR